MITEQASLGTPSAEPSLPWYQVWLKALTEPRVAAYEALVTRQGVSLGKACLWVAIAGIVGALFIVGGGSALRALTALDPALRQGTDSYSFVTIAAISLVCLAPLAVVGSILGLLLSAGISHVLARALGGIGTFTQLAYAFAAYSAPASMISSAVSIIPCVGAIISLPLSVYVLFLNILAIKAVHHISWGRAVVSSVLFVALILAFLACVVIIVLALMGPAIGNVFSGIIPDI